MDTCFKRISPQTATASVSADAALTYLDSRFGKGVMPPNDHFPRCYCAAIGFGSVATEDRLRAACYTFYNQQAMVWLITISSAIGIFLLNELLEVVLTKLAAFERPLTVSSLTASVTVKIFFCQFLNTLVVGFVLNSAFFSSLFGGQYTDFNHKWYATVGLALCLNIASNAVGRHVFRSFVLRLLLKSFKRSFYAKWGAKTPNGLEYAYRPPKFELGSNCGALLNTVVCCLCFSAGMPILVAFAGLAMLWTCVCDKYMLLKVCQKPPVAYDEVGGTRRVS